MEATATDCDIHERTKPVETLEPSALAYDGRMECDKVSAIEPGPQCQNMAVTVELILALSDC